VPRLAHGALPRTMAPALPGSRVLRPTDAATMRPIGSLDKQGRDAIGVPLALAVRPVELIRPQLSRLDRLAAAT
jgi:hypothetical protein